MKTNKIYINDWLELHPYEKHNKSDLYYLKVCNEVNEIFSRFGHLLFEEEVHLNGKKLSCLLVTWFEDLVSEVGIWRAFISRHHELYNKYLPFYNLDDYYDGEPNQQDITFLIWYYISMKLYDKMVFSPSADLLFLISRHVYNVLDEKWDDAPINHEMKDFLNLPATEADFYSIRYVIDWLVLNSYLFYFYGEKNNQQKIQFIQELKKESGDLQQYEGLIFGLHDDNVHNTITSLLAMKGKEWLTHILGSEHPLHNMLLAMGDKKTGRFLYLDYDDENIRVKHIASGKIINITRKSMVLEKRFDEKTVITMGIIYWYNEWWFTGSLFTTEYDDNVLLEETSNPTYAGLFETDEKKHPFLLEHYESFLEFNHQKPVKYLENKEAYHYYLNDFIHFHNRRMDKLMRREPSPRQDKKFNLDNESPADESSVLLFFNRETGMEIMSGFNNVIPDPDNPYFDPSAKNVDIAALYFGNAVSKDLILYLSKINYCPAYKFPNDDNEELLKENLDFLLRFYKAKSYHGKVQITLL